MARELRFIIIPKVAHPWFDYFHAAVIGGYEHAAGDYFPRGRQVYIDDSAFLGNRRG